MRWERTQWKEVDTLVRFSPAVPGETDYLALLIEPVRYNGPTTPQETPPPNRRPCCLLGLGRTIQLDPSHHHPCVGRCQLHAALPCAVPLHPSSYHQGPGRTAFFVLSTQALFPWTKSTPRGPDTRSTIDGGSVACKNENGQSGQ